MNNQIDIKIEALLNEIAEKTYLLAQYKESNYKLQVENKELKNKNKKSNK